MLVGRITTNVDGMTLPSSTPATSHQKPDPASQAAKEASRPTAAQAACMTVAQPCFLANFFLMVMQIAPLVWDH